MLISLDVEKELRGEYWTNRYVLDVPNLSAGTFPADVIVACERAIMFPDVTVTRYRLSDNVQGTDQFIIIPVNQPGTRSVASQALPLFDVVRVDFPTPLGRPSRKYLRGVLAESDQENYGDLLQATVDFVTTAYANPVGDTPEYVDVDGQPLGRGRVWPNVAMRQLRRGSRRRTQPILG